MDTLALKELRIEDATSTRKRTSNSISNKPQRSSVIVNSYPENQHSYGRKSSASESKFTKRKNQKFVSAAASLVA